MELTIQLSSPEEAMALFGLGDRNLRLLREALPVQVTARGELLRLSGAEAAVEEAAGVLNGMISLLREGTKVSPEYLENQLRKRQQEAQEARTRAAPDGQFQGLMVPAGKAVAGHDGVESPAWKPLTAEERLAVEGIARSPGQAGYIQAILKNDVVFCIGPAGTGKTFLAVRMAVNALRDGQMRKMILCRPAVEAGEKLGFLPGDFQAKINPYLRPLYDALNEILDYEQVRRYLEREIIEIIPLAYMRGRTLNNAFIILDEGQNTTISQMKMFLTRMGLNSRIVVNGDITQVDLPEGQPSGLIHAQRIVRDIPGIAWVQLGGADIVRHALVKRIVEAYERSTTKRR